MIPAEHVVNLSRLQFGLTALYHFLFVPLTLGLSILLGIMETIYVMTGRPIWRQMTQYWGILFGINFAMGVATGITMEFQFGTNWAYYAHYVGDIFGAPLAIEGMMAFFLEATFVGLFFFGWNKLSKGAHLTVTWLLALGANFSALWILIANAWMQHPVGAHFNFHNMRMEMNSFTDLFFNPVAQAKFVHTVSGGYVTGAVFVLAVSAWFLLRGKHIEFAKRSMQVAVAFGLASALSVVVLGDESGYVAGQNQKMKVAAIEAMWDTEQAPAALTLFGFPDQKARMTHYELKLPYALGLIATRSIDLPVYGINQLVEQNRLYILDGMKAYSALNILQKNPNDMVAQKMLSMHEAHLGYALLLKRYTLNVVDATPEQISQAANDTVPGVAPLFWAFRGMVGCGLLLIGLFATGFYLSCRRKLDSRRYLLWALMSLPLPWIANELGWFVAEYGRQPWVIDGVLPTFLGVSSLSSAQLYVSLASFIIFYSILAVVEVMLMLKYIKQGPSGPLIPGQEDSHD